MLQIRNRWRIAKQRYAGLDILLLLVVEISPVLRVEVRV
jgi:hypothetical protein